MARVTVLSGAAILDTSLLLELYRVPGYFDESRTSEAAASDRQGMWCRSWERGHLARLNIAGLRPAAGE